MTRALTPQEYRRRVAVARAVVAAGDPVAEFARRAGMKPAAATNWLSRNEPELHRALKGSGRSHCLSGHRALVRLLLIKSVHGIRGGQTRLARALGMSPNHLAVFKNQWAPDGLDAAIADLMPEDADV